MHLFKLNYWNKYFSSYLAVPTEVHLDNLDFRAECERLGTAGLPLEGVEGPVKVGSAWKLAMIIHQAGI